MHYPHPTENLLSSAAAARLLDVTPDRVRQLARSGRLRPAVRSSYGVALYTRAEIERYRDERAAAAIHVEAAR